MLERFITLSLIVFFALVAKGQYQIPVLPELDGQELILELVKEYKPATVLSYGEARDTLYSKIYKRNDSVYCVYSGYALYLPPNTDPSTFLLSGGSEDGINAEHTYPQSKGAGNGNARSDMHHLYPARAGVNSARSNYPFAEIPDNETDTWFFNDYDQPFIPSSNIELYSEVYLPATFEERRFEPREDHKGNVARAIFYFYTMYRSEANAADPFYFSGMRETLCDWHFLDPVDSLEWVQNYQKAAYQDGRPNPFILDCSLPERSYCADLPLSCLTAINEPNKSRELTLKAYPNPTYQIVHLTVSLPISSYIAIDVFNILGEKVMEIPPFYGEAGDTSMPVDIEALPAGLFFFEVKASSQREITHYGITTVVKQN